jgi:hypothetical protein
MKLKNLFLAIKHQPLKEWVVTRNAWGIFSINSHRNQHTGKDKVAYPTKESADRAANAMNKKNGTDTLVSYKCAHCDGWHIGNNRR